MAKKASKIHTIGELEAASGVSARTLRIWIRRKLLPKPLGKGRGAHYVEEHVLRARLIQHLRSTGSSLNAIRRQIGSRSVEEIRSLLPQEPRARTMPEGVPAPPPEPTYPSITWELVQLTDGLVLMVNSNKGPVPRRIADEIYRYYGAPRTV